MCPRWTTLTGGKIMAGEVIIDTEECIGCEACVELCPEVFAFDSDEEKASVIEELMGMQRVLMRRLLRVLRSVSPKSNYNARLRQ